MKKWNTAFMVFFTAFIVNAQMAVFQKEIPRLPQLTYYAVNHLGDTVFIKNNEITKKTKLKTYTFKDPFLGEIDRYDERNPLQQLVFYKNIQQIVLLDNQLSIKEKMVLADRFPEIDAAYASLTAQASIWIFDQASKRWCIISSRKEYPQFISNPITDYTFLTTDGNFSYWQKNDVVYGIDIYGKVIPQKNLSENAKLLATNNDLMVYILNNKLFLFNTKQNKTEQLTEITSTVSAVFFNAKILSVLTAEKMYLYQIN